MNLKQILPGKWYLTAKGEGRCMAVNGGRCSFDFPNGQQDWLKASEVKHELAKGQEPKGEPPVSILHVLETVKLHLDELAEAWESCVLDSTDANALRMNRNANIRRMLEKVIAHEKGEQR